MVRSIYVPTRLELPFFRAGYSGQGGNKGAKSGWSLTTNFLENTSMVATVAWGALASGDFMIDGEVLPCDFNKDGMLDCVAEVSSDQVVDGPWSCGIP